MTIVCASHRRLLVDYEHFEAPAWVEYQKHVGYSVARRRELSRILRLGMPDPILETRRAEGAPWYVGRFDARWIRYAAMAGQWIEQCVTKGQISVAKQTHVIGRSRTILFFADILSAMLPVFPIWTQSVRDRGAAAEFVWRTSPLRRLPKRPTRQHDMDPPWPEMKSAEVLTFPAQPVDFRAAALLLTRALCQDTSMLSACAFDADAQTGWKEFFLNHTPAFAMERVQAAALRWPRRLQSVLALTPSGSDAPARPSARAWLSSHRRHLKRLERIFRPDAQTIT